MFLISRALTSVALILNLVIETYIIIVIAASVLTWIKPDPFHPIVKFIHQVTDPVFSFVRSKLPASFFVSGIDFTPVIVILGLVFIDNFLVQSLSDLGHALSFSSDPILSQP